MTGIELLHPVFVEVALTFALAMLMLRARMAALAHGSVTSAAAAGGSAQWPARASQLANCFANQFELPVLFYVVVGFIIVTRTPNIAHLVLAWVFVASRLAHAVIQTGGNDLQMRFRAYAVGAVALMAMWIILAARVLSS